MAENVFDAIVIGSGISGGWTAKELGEKELEVMMLERGKNVEHIKDYKRANKAPWEFSHRGRHTQQMIENYPVLKRDYPLNEKNLDWWASDKDCPYTKVKWFDWFRAYQVEDLKMFVGYKVFEPNLYCTTVADWGQSLLYANKLGPKAYTLIDLGHHLPNVNIKQIVALLLMEGGSSGFHRA